MAVTWKKLAYYDEVIPPPAGAAQGEILYFGGVTWDKLAVGNDGEQLTTHGAAADPTWEAGAGTFIGLPDTPAGFVLAGAYYKVNVATDAIEEGLVAGVASGLATLDAGSLVAQEPKLHAAKHQSGGDDEMSIADLAGKSTELATHEAVKAANAILGHVIVEDTSLIDVDAAGKLTLGAHAATHKDGAADEILLDELGEPIAAVAMDGQQLTDHVIHTVDDNAAMLALTPLVGKMCWRTDELHPYVCTIAA